MSVPSFLATGFAFTTLNNVTDVQTIMDAIVTMLTSTLSATPTGVYPSGERWSKTGAGPYLFTAPSDNGGRFMKLTLTRTTALRLEWTFSDPGGVLTDGEIDIAAGGSQVFIYGGPGHLFVETNNAGTWENAAVCMIDPTPEPLASSTTFVFGRVFRDTTGAIISGRTNLTNWLGRYTGGTVYGTMYYANAAIPFLIIQNSVNTKLRTVAGSDVVAPIYMANDISNFGAQWIGGAKLYQMIVVSGDQADGAILTVPLDTGVTGQFQVTHLGITGLLKLAVRIG